VLFRSLYAKDLPPAVRDTWIQLRGLAWGRQETPSLSLVQLSEILEKKRSTLYVHMRLLQARGALRWRPGSKSEIIVVFPSDEELLLSESLDEPVPLKPGDADSLNIPVKDSAFRNSRKPDGDLRPSETVPDSVLKPFVNTLADVTGMQADLNYPRLVKSARKLHKSGYPAQQIASLYGVSPGCRKTAWYERDWRGLKDQRPTPEQIEQTIAVLAAPSAGKSSADILRRLAEKEGINYDDL
jgi:hypothetical protein